MALSDNVYVMNEDTWQRWKDSMVREALKHESPMPYLKFVSKLEVVIDNVLKDDVIEVYRKEAFESLERNLDDDTGDDFERSQDWFDREDDEF